MIPGESVAGLLHGLGAVGIALWALLLLALLAAAALALRLEGREWQRRGRHRAWLAMRLGLLPITVIALLLAWLAMPRVSGMEGLAVAYLFLLVVAPAIFFVLHLLLGRLQSPPLPKSASLLLALTGLLGLIVIPLAIDAVAPAVRMLARAAASRLIDHAPEAPGVHRVASSQRFVDDRVGEIWTFHLEAPAGIRLDRAQLLLADAKPIDLTTTLSPWACRAANDLYLLLPLAAQPTRLEIVWSGGGLPQRSHWTLTQPSGEARRFEPAWPDDGVALPVRLPKAALDVGFSHPTGRIDWNSASSMIGQPGESLDDFGCMKTPYRYPRAVVAVRLRIEPPGPGGLRRQADFRRPGESSGGP